MATKTPITVASDNHIGAQVNVTAATSNIVNTKTLRKHDGKMGDTPAQGQ